MAKDRGFARNLEREWTSYRKKSRFFQRIRCLGENKIDRGEPLNVGDSIKLAKNHEVHSNFGGGLQTSEREQTHMRFGVGGPIRVFIISIFA